jgi:hypothetical protein
VTGLARFKDLCLDAGDHQALADWWCRVLGYERRPRRPGQPDHPEWPIAIFDPSGKGPLLWIIPVAEAKVVKNRMHIDVFGDKFELIEAGASLVRARDGDIGWDVMADPEGNEFCVFAESPE